MTIAYTAELETADAITAVEEAATLLQHALSDLMRVSTALEVIVAATKGS